MQTPAYSLGYSWAVKRHPKTDSSESGLWMGDVNGSKQLARIIAQSQVLFKGHCTHQASI